VLGFERLEVAQQGVVGGVGDLGRVEHVIKVLVVAELVAQVFDLFGGGHVAASPVGARSINCSRGRRCGESAGAVMCFQWLAGFVL
jgi:hypothetical protein